MTADELWRMFHCAAASVCDSKAPGPHASVAASQVPVALQLPMADCIHASMQANEAPGAEALLDPGHTDADPEQLSMVTTPYCRTATRRDC